MKKLRKIIEDFIVRKYVKYGLLYGEHQSFFPIGIDPSFDKIKKKYNKWKERYERLGFYPLNDDLFLEAGGYGYTKYEKYLRCDRVGYMMQEGADILAAEIVKEIDKEIIDELIKMTGEGHAAKS